MTSQTIWTRLGGTKFIAFLLLAVWGMAMIQTGVEADPVLLDFVRYVFWGFVLGNVGNVGIQTYAASVTAAKVSASNVITTPESKS